MVLGSAVLYGVGGSERERPLSAGAREKQRTRDSWWIDVSWAELVVEQQEMAGRCRFSQHLGFHKAN